MHPYANFTIIDIVVDAVAVAIEVILVGAIRNKTQDFQCLQNHNCNFITCIARWKSIKCIRFNSHSMGACVWVWCGGLLTRRIGVRVENDRCMCMTWTSVTLGSWATNCISFSQFHKWNSLFELHNIFVEYSTQNSYEPRYSIRYDGLSKAVCM